MPNWIFTLLALALCLLGPTIQFGYYLRMAFDYVDSYVTNQSVLYKDYDFIVGKL